MGWRNEGLDCPCLGALSVERSFFVLMDDIKKEAYLSTASSNKPNKQVWMDLRIIPQ